MVNYTTFNTESLRICFDTYTQSSNGKIEREKRSNTKKGRKKHVVIHLPIYRSFQATRTSRMKGVLRRIRNNESKRGKSDASRWRGLKLTPYSRGRESISRLENVVKLSREYKYIPRAESSTLLRQKHRGWNVVRNRGLSDFEKFTCDREIRIHPEKFDSLLSD